MKALLQRVSMAEVWIDGQRYNRIEKGILVLLGVEKKDITDKDVVDKTVNKILKYRLFQDENDQMNLNVTQVEGEILVVSQFTLAADTKKGLRPSFSQGAHPSDAEPMYERFVQTITSQYPKVKTGIFAANMEVGLVNDGPVTFLLEF